ncbi:hypothetical protein M9H77_13437 [Catharanthus roseus]|uniref:Uncharacterized protein n=1 Tax=Catharanthus roseus TaxID=4058 RepID=A0ACC0BKE2_CATRO|nr:hypothetical protein M9H77_13437 [Catharanthus roseus]
MHRNRVPYRCGLFKTVDNYCEVGFDTIQVFLRIFTSGQWSFCVQVHMKTPFRPGTDTKILFCRYYVAHHSRRWICQEGTLVSGSSGTSPSSSYFLREIVPERDPILLIDLSDSEMVEGPVAQGMELGVSIEEDPSEAESDAEMLPELEGVALVAAEGIDTLVVGGSLSHYQYRLFVEAASQQTARLREEILRMDAFWYTARQAHRTGGLELPKLGHSGTNHGPGTISKNNSKRRLRAQLQRALAPLPPMGFAATIEAATSMEMVDRASRDSKRSRGEQRIESEGRQTQTLGGVHRVFG